MTVGHWLLYGGLFIIFRSRLFDSTTVTGSRKVGSLNRRLTTPVGLLLSLQLTVLSCSVIVL